MDRRTRRKIRQFFLGYDEDHTPAQPLLDRRTRRKIRQFFLGYDEDHTLAQPLSTLPERTWSFLTGARWQTIVTKPVPKQLPDLAGEKAADCPTFSVLPSGYIAGREPRKSWIQVIFSRLLEARQEDGKSLPYPFYGIARFGFWDAMFRTWVYHVHPKNGLDWLQNRIRRY